MIKFSDRQKNIAKILLCLGIGVICYIFALTNDLSYDTNDDPAAMILHGKGSYFSPLFAKPFSALLGVLYGYSPQTPWWLFITLATIAISISITLYVVSRRFNKYNAIFVAVPIVLFFLITTTEEINFTRTAAAAAVAGILLILQGIDDYKDSRKLAIALIIMGTIVWIWGAMIRDQIAFVVIPFAGVFLIAKLIGRAERFHIKQFIDDAKTPVLIALAALFVGFFTLVVSGLFYTDAERESIEYYDARISVQDYASNYKSYMEAEDEYLALGVSENDYTMIFTDWSTEDTNFFTTELFEEMRQTLYSPNTVFKSVEIVFSYLLSDWYSIVVIAIFATLIAFSAKRRVGLLIMFAVLFAYLFYLAFLGRVEGRVVEPVFLYAIIFALIYSDISLLRGDIKQTAKSTSLILLNSMLVIFLFLPIISSWAENLKIELAKNHAVGTYNLNAHNFYNMIAEEKDEIYFLPIMNSLELLPSERISPKYQPDVERIENLFFLGGWDARTPVNYDAMAEYGIVNPMEALFNNKNVLSGFDTSLDTYLREHYGEDISLTLAKYITQESGYNYGFFQYCLPIEEDILYDENAEPVYIENYYYLDYSDGLYISPDGGCVTLSGALGKEGIDEYEELFFNMETEDGRLSYRVFVDDSGNFNCRLYTLTEEMISHSVVSIVAKTSEGEYIEIQKLGEFIETAKS